MGSQIPVIGRNHRIDVFRFEEVDDGAGGVDLTRTITFQNLRCRISPLTQKDSQDGFGLDSSKNFQVIVKGSPDILESDLIKKTAGTRETPLDNQTEYRILARKKQTDFHGRINHLVLVVEKEDADN